MIRMRFEFKIEDSWVGVFWRKTVEECVSDRSGMIIETSPRLDVWVCFVPWFPLHIVHCGKPTEHDIVEYLGTKAIEGMVDE